jgi:hypothetical protein
MQVSFRQGEKPAMLLRGDAQQRAKAKELASDLIASDTAEYFKVRQVNVSRRQQTSAYKHVSIRQHTSACVSISEYASIRQHTLA